MGYGIGFLCLHDALGVPKNGVGVEVSRGVEPEVELLLSVAFALSKNICVNNIRFAAYVAQEFVVYLIPQRPF